MTLGNYPKIWNLGHKEVSDIWNYEVHVEEKIDGSQFSFGVDSGGQLFMKTHHCDVTNDKPFGLFEGVMTWCAANKDKMRPGWTYRGEVIAKPKHNHLAYERVPAGNIVIFDIDRGMEDFLGYIDKQQEALRLGLETVPYMFYGTVNNPETVRSFLDRKPLLGGKMIEGIVIKAYGHYGEDKKTLMAKLVSEKYKEVAKEEGNTMKPAKASIIEGLVAMYKTEARWRKAFQTLRDNNVLKLAPSDIPALRNEVMRDIEVECGDAIKNALYMSFKNDVLRGSVNGLPEWWKQTLVDMSFEKPKEEPSV